jgi:ParB family chromosome partitioning protein
MAERRPALGKGLSALIPDAPEVRQGPIEVDVDLLSPGDQQPRLAMDDSRLEDLAASIRMHGIIQPIVVSRAGNAFRIIAGERRWRAAQRAGLLKVPVVVRGPEASDKELLEIALIENVQREDLNPIDEARAFERLASEFGRTQDQIAAAVGKDRSSVANSIRLLKLAEDVRAHVSSGNLSVGHARALLGLPDAAAQRQAAREVMTRSLSVREAEALVKRLGSPPRPTRVGSAARSDVHTRAAEDKMRFSIGAKVAIRRRGRGGTVEIHFESENELNRIFEHLTAGK